jgi:hypothetical protein
LIGWTRPFVKVSVPLPIPWHQRLLGTGQNS